MKRRIYVIAWLTASFVVLGLWFWLFGLNPELSRILRNESQVYLIIGMTVLTFPAGLLYVYLFGIVVYGLSSVGIELHQYEKIEVCLLWGGFVLIGYLQWFVLLPFIRKKIPSRQAGRKMHH